jgi:hypothetical protein
VRFCAEKYSTDATTLEDTSKHLCNNAINRRLNSHVNETNWTLTELRKWLQERFPEEDKFAVVSKFYIGYSIGDSIATDHDQLLQ